MPEKSPAIPSAVFQRLRRLQVGESMTWGQIAAKLGVSVSMLMMVKSGARDFSAKSIHRLEQVEHEIAGRKSRADRMVEEMFTDGQGCTGKLVARLTGKKTRLEFEVGYSRRKTGGAFPKKVVLSEPPEQARAKLRQLFAETMDTAVVLLSCLPETLRQETFLGELTADSRMRLTRAALDLVIPEWRSLAAKSSGSPG